MPPEAVDVLVRPLAADDGEAAARTLLASHRAAEAAGELPTGPHDDAEFLRWFEQDVMPNRDVWVAESGGDLVGVLVLDQAWLDHLYVHPDRAGQGIGSLLLCLATAVRPRGFDLWVFQTNTAAARFYERHGLVEVERTDGAGNEEQAADIRYRWERR